MTESSALALRMAVVGIFKKIDSVSIPLLTTKLAGRVKEVRSSASLNIAFIFVTLEVLKLAGRVKEVRLSI